MGGLRDGDAVLTPVTGMLCHYAADSLVHGFLRGNCDSILFIDDDMVFSNSDLDTLRDDVDGFEYDGLMGLCQSRRPPHKPIIMQTAPCGKFLIPDKPPRDKIVDVGIVGLGFTLIRRSVFEKMEKPYFYFSERGDGEDATFSINATELGFKLGVSTRVQIGHRFPICVKWNFEGDGLDYLSTNNETQKGG